MATPATLPDNDRPQSVESRLAHLEARMDYLATKEDLQAFRTELHDGLNGLRTEMYDGLNKLRTEMHDGLHELKFDLIKIMAWGIGALLTGLSAIAGLAISLFKFL